MFQAKDFSQSLLRHWLSEWRHLCATIAFVFVSLAWIWVVARYGYDKQDAGRGGAIGVAASFAILFWRRDYIELAYKTSEDIRAAKVEIESLVDETKSTWPQDARREDVQASITQTALALEAGSQAFQNKLLAISSVVGTMAWGFGDWAVGVLRDWHLLGCRP